MTAEEATAYCRDTLTCIEKVFTPEQFETVESNMLSGKANPDIKLVSKCAESATKKRR